MEFDFLKSRIASVSLTNLILVGYCAYMEQFDNQSVVSDLSIRKECMTSQPKYRTI